MGLSTSVAACKGTSEEFFLLKKQVQPVQATAEGKKSEKVNAFQLARVSEQAVPAHGSMNIMAAMGRATSVTLDEAIARLCYAENLPFKLVDSPHFRQVIALARTSSPSYAVPHRHRLAGDLLDTTTARLSAEAKPLRDSLVKHGCTILSDGCGMMCKVIT